jgi:hypothetical protein
VSKKKGDIYLRALSGVFIKDVSRAGLAVEYRMIIKVQAPGGDDLVGFSFETIQELDSVMNALYRIRQEMTAQDVVHPKLKGPTDGLTH